MTSFNGLHSLWKLVTTKTRVTKLASVLHTLANTLMSARWMWTKCTLYEVNFYRCILSISYSKVMLGWKKKEFFTFWSLVYTQNWVQVTMRGFLHINILTVMVFSLQLKLNITKTLKPYSSLYNNICTTILDNIGITSIRILIP